QRAKALGYNGLFLTDHNGASNFRITTWMANNVFFEDATAHWIDATYGGPNSSAQISSAQVNTGTKSLLLSATGPSNNVAERFYYEKRGPNFRSGDIHLKVSIFPTRLDPGSGAYVSVAIGGDD